jgi:hypothetical protein
MNDAKLFIDFIQGIAIQLPILLAAGAGIVVTLSRWRDASSAGAWSLAGFGFAIILCLLVPASQAGVRYWITHNSGHASDVAMIFTALNVFWSRLCAASYICLLVAIFAGRPKSAEVLR